MECPSCGYQNQEGAQYCNMCLYSFIKPQPEPQRPRQLQTQMVSPNNATSQEPEELE